MLICGAKWRSQKDLLAGSHWYSISVSTALIVEDSRATETCLLNVDPIYFQSFHLHQFTSTVASSSNCDTRLGQNIWSKYYLIAPLWPFPSQQLRMFGACFEEGVIIMAFVFTTCFLSLSLSLWRCKATDGWQIVCFEIMEEVSPRRE